MLYHYKLPHSSYHLCPSTYFIIVLVDTWLQAHELTAVSNMLATHTLRQPLKVCTHVFTPTHFIEMSVLFPGLLPALKQLGQRAKGKAFSSIADSLKRRAHRRTSGHEGGWAVSVTAVSKHLDTLLQLHACDKCSAIELLTALSS